MILRPCLHCPFRRDCAIKTHIHRRVRGLGLTVASFKCDEKWTGFAVGSRVEMLIKTCVDGMWEEEEGEREGTVIGFKDDRALVWLDDPIVDEVRPEPRVRIKMHRNRLFLLASPKRKCCPECGRPEGAKNREGWGCRTCEEDEAEGPTRWGAGWLE